MQVPLARATAAIAFTHPADSVKWTGILALVIAFCSATQDISISAYRIEIIPREEPAKIAHASAAETAGWWTGYALLGSVPFFLADMPGWTWNRIYLLLAAMWIPLMVAVILAREGKQRRERFKEAEEKYEKTLAKTVAPGLWARVTAWLAVTVVEPIKEFFDRTGVRLGVSVLLFLFLFKLGEAFLGRMAIVFKEVGSRTRRSRTTQTHDDEVTILFSMAGGLLSARIGIIKGSSWGHRHGASNLMFPGSRSSANEALRRHHLRGQVHIRHVHGRLRGVHLVFHQPYTGTQYALLASIRTLGRTFVSDPAARSTPSRTGRSSS